MIDSFLSSIEEDNTFLPKEINAIKACSNDPAQFLTKIMIHSLRESNRCSYNDSSFVWKRGDNYIRIIKGNIFNYALGRRMKKERIVVIPVNTSFDVHVSTQLEAENFPLVSKNTIHGDFLSRLYKGIITEDELQSRIRQNLILNGMCLGVEKKPLPIGTIATLTLDKATIYLLAISSFNDHNNAQSSYSDIQTAINELVRHYNQKGQGYDLYLPLLGTGMSRANLSYQDSIDLIIKTLLDSKNSLQGKYNIVVLPEKLKEITIRTEDEYSEN